MQTSRILVTCPKAIPPILADEIRTLGFPVLAQKEAAVETSGTLHDTMRLNLWLRTGHRVLFLLQDFRCRTPAELYGNLVRLPWENYLEAGSPLSITSAVHNDTIKDTRFANLKCKDAIVDRLKRTIGRRPDSGPRRRGAVVFLYWKESEASLYLDTSGESLAKRGYRKIPLQAPMQETLAAATILATGWRGEGHFINPMCGSGTLAIEAAWLSLGRPPGLLRDNFGFMHLRSFAPAAWQALLAEAKAGMQKTLPAKIIATDHDPRAVAAARQNAKTAGVDHLIEFAVCDFAATPVPAGGGVIMLNPEYGERLGRLPELQAVYPAIGDWFKQKGAGYTGYVFTGNLELAKRIGLRPRRRLPFFNGAIECRLLEFELYEGSKPRWRR
ncbi:MAG: class I SAM-dependent RNA methyltransferase [candidate division KSB1 bacterium]|nr:class I SAM-dependent RNA methyltransferase [candidate division KSB1 bacterium]MDZ7273382.1 class I SAM-dependent RNA methyltransferase [candidate division KSB1 bacterium]MDZ7288044.1 class I SAM-dependent RNA methyltransferase [candidate division KSB1 bacterium]MDZ7300104.1 class I SAM-dependent RNA methyltransferase [candidate division KSB1 bacterium]MDZ7307228.1 class I SAM-dependent RNA methyltransferase [candidate division KSB1 bacterium]